MIAPGVLVAYACSVVLGAALWFALAGLPRRPGERFAAAGYATLLGLLASGMLVALRRDAAGADTFIATLPLIGAAIVLLAGLGWRRARRAQPSAPVAMTTGTRLPPWAWLLFAAIAVRFAFVLDEAFLRPVFVWDAWNAWSLKAKTWFELGQVRFLDPTSWWRDSDPSAHTALAWRYPELLSRIELWLASAAGAWNEGAVATAWPLLWLALVAGCAGQWRALGVSRNACVVLAYLLASLPLLSVHAALAGYADLWVAATLTFAVLAWLRWLRDGDRAQLLLATCCTGALPLLKFEGAVWALLLTGLAILVQVPPRWRRIGLIAAVFGALLAVAASWALQLPWLALVRDVLSGVAAGDNDVSRFVAATAFFKGLFAQNNWHLLWPLLVACLIWQRERLRDRREIGLLALLLGAGLAALFCLFVFTPAAKWATSETAMNRLVLQWAPLALSLIGLLLRDVRVPARRPDALPH
ncbi:MAG TPA: hypothetical protein VLF18_12315 [Tahibacter sp.]|uniref:hypothetical protein n=1 Tax=Tahibacter sp. TaxID=2056211 RepID=UPI002C39C8E1|nr:hypothetical protein [Tahibacter sp.]HSX60978.1 hypothetical protein [Tahibacter sp.]